MQNRQNLNGRWFLRKATEEEASGAFSAGSVLNGECTDQAGWYESEHPLSVHEILLEYKVIPEEVKIGEAASCTWVAEADWIYQKTFSYEKGAEKHAELFFGGLDTEADVYLNGEWIASNHNMYMPLQVDVTEHLRPSNVLVLYFHSPYKIIREKVQSFPEAWRGRVEENKVLRKAHHDFIRYLGAKPYLTPIGVYGEIELRTYGSARLSDVSHRCRILPFSLSAELDAVAETAGQDTGCTVRFELYAPDGTLESSSEQACGAGRTDVILPVKKVQLWWPRPYGEHPLYRLETTLLRDGEIIDTDSRKIGLREIRRVGDFQFKVNGRLIKLWGSNVAPFQALSHRWDPERALKVLSLARDANMNTLRIWGEGVPYGEELYEFCDREGILLIHDLFSQYGYWPDDRAYRDLCLADTEYLIRRVRGHACILMWFGNNEAYMFAESEEGGKQEIGFATFMLDFARLCEKLDPDRFFSPSSPYGGRFANDALEGDTHSYNGAYHVPGLQYPVFFSEDCYTTALPLHSMQRFMKEEEIFPEGYVNFLPYGKKNPAYDVNRHKYGFRYWRNLPVPETWHRYLDEYAQCEYWGAERYYDATDAESLVYRFSACAADYFKTTVERVRRGIPTENGTGLRRTQGHLNWKLNDAFPMISFTLIDAFLELTQPYYSIKRAYSPVLLSIEIGDHIRLWGVNDTAEDVDGTLEFLAFSKFDNAVRESFTMPVRLLAGESRIFTTLDHIGPIRRDCVLYCILKDTSGTILARNVEHFDMERDTLFPEAALSLRMEGEELVITTDQYAHCVTLTGDEAGDAFGWEFSDNYFHLLPFETKRVWIGGNHAAGTITAKSYYSPYTASVPYRKPE